MANENKKKSLGERAREIIRPALEDDRRRNLQLELLSDAFNDAAKIVERVLKEEFDHFAQYLQQVPDSERNLTVIEAMTTVNPRTGEPNFAPAKKMPIMVCSEFADYSAMDVRDLPGFIKFHEKMRDLDVAVKIMGLIGDDKKMTQGRVIAAFDLSKSYNEGAMDNPELYPNLPPPSQKKSGDFNL